MFLSDLVNMSALSAVRSHLTSIVSPKTKTESKRLPKKKKNYPVVSVIGMSRLCDPSYSKKLKMFWASVLITVSILCIIQLIFCLKMYLDYSVIKNLTHMRTSMVTFPIIYLCPGFMRDVFYASIVAKKNGKDIYSDLLETITKEINKTSLDEVWQEQLTIPSASIEVYTGCTDVESDICTEHGRKITAESTQIPSFWGTCVVLLTNITMAYLGPFTFLRIVFDSSKLNMSTELKNKINIVQKSVAGMQESALLLFLRDEFTSNINHRLFYTSEVVLAGFVTHYKIRTKKFQHIDVKNDHCYKTKQFSDCIQDCLNRHLSGISTKCHMPYIRNKSLEICTPEAANVSYVESYSLYVTHDFTTCNCHQDCETTIYDISSNVIEKTRNNYTTEMMILFTDDIYELTTTRRAYGLTNLLSDFGGTLGFYLGFCSLSLVEILEFFAVCIYYSGCAHQTP